MSAPIDQLPVGELVNRAKAGSLNAFSELVARYEGRLLNFLRQRTRSVEDAEDVTQESFLRAWRQLDRYDSRWQFSTWLFTIGSRLAVNHAQRRAGGCEGRGAGGEGFSVREDGDPARAASDAEQRRNLWSLAERTLGESERVALWLRYAEELPAGDIGRVLGKSAVGVRVLIHRAKRKLARALDESARGVRTGGGMCGAERVVVSEMRSG